MAIVNILSPFDGAVRCNPRLQTVEKYLVLIEYLARYLVNSSKSSEARERRREEVQEGSDSQRPKVFCPTKSIANPGEKMADE